MSFTNVEIKARTNRLNFIRTFLSDHNADFKGTDHQVDTYFNVPFGRLKLRQGNIENALIFYQRKNQAGPKQSDCTLLPVLDGELLRTILSEAVGIKVIVEKKREIYYIDNVKFHLDILEGAGDFVEIEASNKTHPLSHDQLHEQCNYYTKMFHIKEHDLVDGSYSDMLAGLREGVVSAGTKRLFQDNCSQPVG